MKYLTKSETIGIGLFLCVLIFWGGQSALGKENRRDYPPLTPPKEGDFGAECWAVIIGIADYVDSTNDLNYADDDAYDMYNALLSDTIHWQADHIMLLIDEEADRAGIVAGIDWLVANAGPDDTAVFFFSGIGAVEIDDNGDETDIHDEYICPQDFDNISDDELSEMFLNIQAKAICFVADSNFSGGLLQDLAADGRVIIAGCAEDEYTWETSSLQNGVFSYFFVEGLKNGDVNFDMEVSAEEAFNYAKPLVMSYMTGLQNPQMDDRYSGELSLVSIITPEPDIEIFTNQDSYSEGDTMTVTVHVTNLTTDSIWVWILVYLELPNGDFTLPVVAKLCELFSGFDFEVTVFSVEVPSIPVGEYTWWGLMVNPGLPEVIDWDTADWQFTSSSSTATKKAERIMNLQTFIEQIRLEAKVE